MKSTYRKAREKWGMPLQILVAIEEMSELTKALIKLQRKGFSEDMIEAVEEEIADVKIMLEQLETFIEDRYGRNNVEQIKQIKQNRVREMLIGETHEGKSKK